MKNKIIYDFWQEIQAEVTESQQAQYEQYFMLIHEHNQYLNLTGIDDHEGVYLKHFTDCLLNRHHPIIQSATKVADLGSGAGFPGLVLAIYFPQKKFYLIEPLTKRCKFLEHCVEVLGLTNVLVLNERMEDIEQKFDLVVTRAVAKFSILLELCAQVIEIDGHLCALKGPKGEEELKEAQKALEILNYKVVETTKLILPVEESKRDICYVQKIGKAEKKYPRNYGQIKKNPL